MNIRAVVALSLLLALNACASEHPGPASLGQATSPFTTASLSASAGPLSRETGVPQELPRKTMSDKVLAAIALERVTGMKPDPARLVP